MPSQSYAGTELFPDGQRRRGWGRESYWSYFNPQSLFGGGQQGIYIAPWETSTILGSDGITPIAGFNQPVGKIADLPDNGNYATQAVTAKQPIYKINENNKPYLMFDGIDDFVEFNNSLALFKSVNGVTIVAVYAFRTVPTSSARYVFFVTNPTVLNARILVGGGGSASGRFVSGGRRLDSDAGAQTANSTATITANVIYAQAMRADYANATVYQYINAALDGVNASFQTAGALSSTDAASAKIASTHTSSFSPIDLYGLIAVPRLLTDAECNQVTSYLMIKAGI